MKNARQDLIQQKNNENRIQNLQNGVAFHKSIPSLLILDLMANGALLRATRHSRREAARLFASAEFVLLADLTFSFLFQSIHIAE